MSEPIRPVILRVTLTTLAAVILMLAITGLVAVVRVIGSGQSISGVAMGAPGGSDGPGGSGGSSGPGGSGGSSGPGGSGGLAGPKFAPANPAAAGPNVAAANSALVPSPTNDTYVPITPCRIVDDRVAGSRGKMVNGTTRTITVGGSTGFAAQGGNPAGCGIPLSATAISANMTANTPTGNGYMRAWPSSTTTEPNATVLTYPNGIGVSGASVLALNAGVAASLTVRNHSGTMYLVIDVTGYYTDQIQAYVRLSVTPAYLYSATRHVLSVTNPSTGQAVIVVDRTVEQCAVTATPASDNQYVSAYTVGNEIIVTAWYLDATTHAEVKANIDFNMMVVC